MGEEGKVKNISHVVIHASNIKESIAFYQFLGFKVDRIISTDFDHPGDINNVDTLPLNRSDTGDYYCVGMGLGNSDPRTITRIELMQWARPERLPGHEQAMNHLGLVRVALSVSGVEALVDRLKKQGHRVESIEKIDISPKLSSVYAHIYDPDGNWLTLMEWIKK